LNPASLRTVQKFVHGITLEKLGIFTRFTSHTSDICILLQCIHFRHMSPNSLRTLQAYVPQLTAHISDICTPLHCAHFRHLYPIHCAHFRHSFSALLRTFQTFLSRFIAHTSGIYTPFIAHTASICTPLHCTQLHESRRLR